jgi:hypothetical protein
MYGSFGSPLSKQGYDTRKDNQALARYMNVKRKKEEARKKEAEAKKKAEEEAGKKAK